MQFLYLIAVHRADGRVGIDPCPNEILTMVMPYCVLWSITHCNAWAMRESGTAFVPSYTRKSTSRAYRCDALMQDPVVRVGVSREQPGDVSAMAGLGAVPVLGYRP